MIAAYWTRAGAWLHGGRSTPIHGSGKHAQKAKTGDYGVSAYRHWVTWTGEICRLPWILFEFLRVFRNRRLGTGGSLGAFLPSQIYFLLMLSH